MVFIILLEIKSEQIWLDTVTKENDRLYIHDSVNKRIYYKFKNLTLYDIETAGNISICAMDLVKWQLINFHCSLKIFGDNSAFYWRCLLCFKLSNLTLFIQFWPTFNNSLQNRFSTNLICMRVCSIVSKVLKHAWCFHISRVIRNL